MGPKETALIERLCHGPLPRGGCEEICANRLPRLIELGYVRYLDSWDEAWYAGTLKAAAFVAELRSKETRHV
jgi:hypothetical protein